MLELVVAFDENRLIGNGKNLPWHIPEDLKHFKELTTGNRIIMGRVTFESIGKPLPNRENIVLSRNFEAKGVSVYNNVEDLLKALDDKKRNFIIGGSKVYKELLAYAEILHISHVKGSFKGDVHFPELDLANFEMQKKTSYEKFDYIIYKRK